MVLIFHLHYYGWYGGKTGAWYTAVEFFSLSVDIYLRMNCLKKHFLILVLFFFLNLNVYFHTICLPYCYYLLLYC